MNISFAKSIIKENMGSLHHFRFCGSRNQIEEFDGIIVKAFPAIFIIELLDGSIRSFSYGDFITNIINIVS